MHATLDTYNAGVTEIQDSAALERRATEYAQRIAGLREELSRSVIGQDAIIEDLLVGLLAGGHVLLEGLPGLGKTLLVRSLAASLGMEFGRIQFTPDLMPTDVVGTRIIDETKQNLSFRFEPGPIFANVVLADEINRTTPKTQSALLEAMQEARVTVGDNTHALPRPFCVIATQNPIELEGTYPLPEAQLDRFLFKLLVRAPAPQDLATILDATTGPKTHDPRPNVLSAEDVIEIQALVRQILCGQHLTRFVAELVHVTSPESGVDESTARSVRYGASPRAGQAIIIAAKVRALLDGRPSVSRHDLERSVRAALRHRIVFSFDAEGGEDALDRLLPRWIEQAEVRAG